MPKPDICIYHGNCADGFGAAWVASLNYDDTVVYVPGVYGHEPPDVVGKHVLMVDFSYKRSVLDRMAQDAASIIILDHHKTAEEELKDFRVYTWGDDARFSFTDAERMLNHLSELGRPPILAVFDMARSGAQMTWDYLLPRSKHRPALIDYIGDRDLWRFDLPCSRAIAAYIFSFPYDFPTWDAIANTLRTDDGFRQAAAEGAAIERKHQKDIAELLVQTRRMMVIGGVQVPVANLPYTMASDAAGTMAADVPFAACYFDRSDARVFSLRSRSGGADVSAIAKAYGGGGHKNAAGFQMPVGWEGDT